MGKQRIIRQMQFYKKYLKGFENAYVSDISAMVGIRESRNIVTEYVLSAEDLIRRTKFDDMFCQSNYPVDIHGKVLKCEGNLTPVVHNRQMLGCRVLGAKLASRSAFGACIGRGGRYCRGYRA